MLRTSRRPATSRSALLPSLTAAIAASLALSAVACSADGGFEGGDAGAPTGMATGPVDGTPAQVREGGASCNPYDPLSCVAQTTTNVPNTERIDGGLALDAGSTSTDSGASEDSGASVARPDSGAAEGGAAVSCGPTNECSNPEELTAIAGDYGDEQQVVHGVGSRWVSIRVKESSSLGGGSTRFSATLVPSTGADYDLAAYMDVEKDVLECSKVAASSSMPGSAIETVKKDWGWAFYDDSRTVRFHVQHVSGPCVSDAPWTLIIRGNR
ncbi:MAG: hypothetical protein U0169_22405 [Polyangiaceae bacterium]